MGGANVAQLLKNVNKEEWKRFKDRWDPVVNNRFLNRNYTCALRTTLLIWEDMNLYGQFKEWKKENEWWFVKKSLSSALNSPSACSRKCLGPGNRPCGGQGQVSKSKK